MFGDPSITRVILDNIPHGLVFGFYLVVMTACGLAALGFIRRISLYRQARPSEPPLRAAPRSLLSYFALHKPLLRDRYAGVAHLLTFYGFVILFIGTCLVFLEHDTPLHFFYGWFYLIASFIIDLGGVAFMIGLTMFLARRASGSSKRILRRWWVAAMIWLLLAIGASGFLLEGARIAVKLPAFERWSSAGYAVALALRAVGIEGDSAWSLHRAVWITHAALCTLFFALLPWRFFGHIFYSAASWATRSRRPRSRLRSPQPGQAPGVAAWRDLSLRDLLQADACTTCGRCNEVCPAAAAGKPLRPRDVVLSIRQAMDTGGPAVVVEDDVLWSCTTCAACNETCPVGIDVYDKIVDLRRGRVEAGNVPAVAAKVFDSSAERFNPFDKPNDQRFAWAAGLNVPAVASDDEPVELLYWIGCAGSFDPQGQSVSKSMVRILNHLGVRYRVLGSRERCTGDPARRLGEEGLFRELAARNIRQFRGHGVTRIITHCPHCFNTFANEYPELGGHYQVEHHSQFLARMIAEGKLSLPADASGDPLAITFHDPCYLGRGNAETKAPRDVLMSLPQLKLVEMQHHGKESFCCGAGGGSMWLDVPGQTRVENLRAAEAVATGASVIATACPFCKVMLDAGGQSIASNHPPVVRDLAELVIEAGGALT